MSCCKEKEKKENCGNGLSGKEPEDVNKTIYVEGCFKNLEQKIDGHNYEGIAISVIVSTFLLLRIIISCGMACKMRKKHQEKKREQIWKMKMNVK